MILELTDEERDCLITAINWCALPDKNRLWNVKKQLMRDKDEY